MLNILNLSQPNAILTPTMESAHCSRQLIYLPLRKSSEFCFIYLYFSNPATVQNCVHSEQTPTEHARFSRSNVILQNNIQTPYCVSLKIVRIPVVVCSFQQFDFCERKTATICIKNLSKVSLFSVKNLRRSSAKR